MLNCSGFIKYSIYNVVSNKNNEKSICIHYSVKSMDHLNDYMSNHAYNMRKEAIDLFGNYFTAKRRILSIEK